jgi:glycerol uptake facilitator-like aquaporin
MYGFVVVFVYVARKFAVCSGNNINPVANLACVIAAVFQCNFRAVLAFTLYLLGDFLGSCLGVVFFNIVY